MFNGSVVRVLALSLLVVSAAPVAAQSPEEQLAAASALVTAKKYPDAATRLEAFLTANPKHAKSGVAAFTLGQCYVQLQQWPKALTAYEKAVATKDMTILAVAQLGLGEAALNSGQTAKAVAALEAAVKLQLQPDNQRAAWFLLGQALLQKEDFARAETAFTKVSQDFPNTEEAAGALLGAGTAAIRLGKSEIARQRLKTLVDRYPKSVNRPQGVLLLAQLDVEAKRYREARAGFEALLRDPNIKDEGPEFLAAAEEGLVGALLELGDFNTAASRLEGVIAKLGPTDTQRYRAHLSLGQCRYRQKQYEPALAAFKEAAKSTEGAVAGEGHYWAANSALAINRPAEAAVEFGKVASRFPKHELAPRALVKAGDAYLAAKDTDAAATAYRTVVEKYAQAPEAAEAQKGLASLVDSVTDPVKLANALKTAPPAERARGTLRLARLYLRDRKWVEAATPLNELLKGKTEPVVGAEAQYLLGLALEGQEKSAPAAAAFAEAVRLDPAGTWAGDAQGRLAWLYLDLKRPADAEKVATAALTAKLSEEAQRQVRLALVQAQVDQEKWEPALESSRQLLALNPPAETVASILYLQGEASEKSGKATEAEAIWDKLATQHAKSPYAAEAMVRLGDARFKAEKWSEARDKYSAVLTAHPTSPVAIDARFKLGSALYRLEQWAPAAAEWDKVAADKNAGEVAPEALYWAGLALEKADKKPEAIQRLSRLVMQFPKHARVANAKVRLAALKAVTDK